MTKDEALKLALKALETLLDSFQRCEAGYPQHIEMRFAVRDTARIAIDRAKEALAQPEQEPVATDWERIARVQDAKLRAMCNEAGGFEKLCEVMDKYEQTTPPQRKPLTDEEIGSCIDEVNLTSQYGHHHFGWHKQFARAIEAAHGIKELV